MIVSRATTGEMEQLVLDLQNQIVTEQENSAKWEAEYRYWFQWADLVTRIIRNGNMSPASRLLYVSLVDKYPQTLNGERVQIQVHDLRENAGWIGETAAGEFLRDMGTANAIDYDSGKHNPETNKRFGYITGNADVLPYPEKVNLKKLESQRKARKKAEEQRKKLKHQLQILECEECGKASIVNDIVAKCTSCGHVHDPILGVPSALITIEAEVVEIVNEEDESLDSQAPAPRPAPVTVTALPLEYSTHPPESLQRANEKCPICGRTRRECYIPVTDAPGIWTFSCM